LPPSPLDLPAELPRVALVTGAAKRIGRELALTLARRGFALAVHYRNSAADAEAFAREIEAAGGRAASFRADLMVEAEVEALVPAVVARLGPLGVLVNSAGPFERDTIATVNRRIWDEHIDVILRAPVVLCQAFARQLPQSAKGVIVNLLDQRVLKPGPTYISYGVAKSGLWALTQALALALAPRIRVNGIGPGFMLADAQMDKAEFARYVARQPLKTGGTPAEAAAALDFILSVPSMTGQVIALDGGQHLA
jgi:NAD(P)-dependent dehydrogenase (short-subunit alcohol dehydrogenase family)